MEASWYGHLSTVKILVEAYNNKGISLDKSTRHPVDMYEYVEEEGNYYGFTSLDIALHSRHQDVINYLESMHAKCSMKCPL